MMKQMKRLTALLVAMAMCLSLLGTSVWAAEQEENGDASQSSQELLVGADEESSAQAEEATVEELDSGDSSGVDAQEADASDAEDEETLSVSEEAEEEQAVDEEEETLTVNEAGDESTDSGEQVSITLSSSEVQMLTGRQHQLTVSVGGSSQPVVWSSSNEKIAAVSQDGLVTSGGTGGKCVITAQIGERNAKCTVYVFSKSNRCGDDIYWYFDSSVGKLKLFGSGATYSYYNSKAPWESQKKKIKRIEVSDGITELGKGVFANCSNLKEVILPGTTELISQYVFDKCKKLDNIFFYTGGSYTYYYNAFSTKPRVFYYKERTSVPDYASMVGTWDQKSTKSAKLILNQCGKKAYWEYIPSSRTLIISGKGPMYNFMLEQYYGCDGWHTSDGSLNIKTVKIEKGITSIGGLAFADTMWAKGSSISIPNTVTFIGTSAFEGTGLKGTVNIPGSVKTLGSYLFHMSEGPKVRLHEGLQTIKAYALIDIGNKSLTIPSTVKSIGRGAFSSHVKKITFKGNAPKFHKKAFTWNDDMDDHPMKLTVYYPKGNKTWKSAIKKQYGGKIKWVAK